MALPENGWDSLTECWCDSAYIGGADDRPCAAACGDRCDEAPMPHPRRSADELFELEALLTGSGSTDCHAGGSAKAAAIDAAVAPGTALNAHSASNGASVCSATRHNRAKINTAKQ